MIEKLKQKTLKDILFFISIIPYIIFLFLGIIRCITNSLKFKFLDLFGFVEPIIEFNYDFGMISILILFIPFCYIMFYVIDKNRYKNDNINRVKRGKKLLLVYFLSFIPYLYLIYSCIFGIEFGLMGSSYTYYGFDAIVIAFMYGCVILVYPIIIVFQILYTKKNYKSFSNDSRNAVKLIIGLLLSILLVFSLLPNYMH